jgi:axial budding pattern protein 2
VLSEYLDIRTGVAEVALLKTGLRKVSKSQGPELDAAGTVRSVSSDYSRHSRPVSRAIQSSPFFAGSSFRMSRHYSRRSPKKYERRISYADSPTVPEESTRFPNQSLETTVLQGLREGSHVKNSEKQERGRRRGRERDSFGITYGMAQEGTRQLRSFIQSQITRARSKKSIRSLGSHKSMKSVDSRFESAAGSMAELHHRQSKTQLQQSPEIQRRRPRSELDFDDWHTDPLPEAEGSVASSWETQNGEESSENVIKYYTEMDEESSRLPLGLDRPNPLFTRQISQSMPSSPIIGEMGMLGNDSPQPRVVRGVGRRPISVDAKASKRGMRARMSQRAELDCTAYI